MRVYPVKELRAMFSILLTGLAIVGCAQNPQGYPYGQGGYGSPWNGQPAPGVQLPPPQGQPGQLPAVPALPPPPNSTVPPQTGSTLSNPGTIQQQRQQATLFDPFADNNAGPEIVGGRPRDFQKPYTDTQKFQGFRQTRWPY